MRKYSEMRCWCWWWCDSDDGWFCGDCDDCCEGVGGVYGVDRVEGDDDDAQIKKWWDDIEIWLWYEEIIGDDELMI